MVRPLRYNLLYLHNLDSKEQREGEGGQDGRHGEDLEEVCEESGPLLAGLAQPALAGAAQPALQSLDLVYHRLKLVRGAQ